MQAPDAYEVLSAIDGDGNVQTVLRFDILGFTVGYRLAPEQAHNLARMLDTDGAGRGPSDALT